MNKLGWRSPNEIQAQVERLAALFPECVIGTKDDAGLPRRVVDFDLLRQWLSPCLVDGPAECYELNWPGKRAALFAASMPVSKTLRLARAESVDFDRTQNLFIEGDNLDGLKLLQETFVDQVKIICIDPPYNTGRDYLYPDDFAQSMKEYLGKSRQPDGLRGQAANAEFSGRFHSQWLSMMYPRLKLARNLLREDGVIFITISDVEVGNLRKLCDEVFGEDNFVANIIWQKKYTRANDARWFSDNHDHVLCFAKQKKRLRLNRLPRNAAQLSAYTNHDHHPKGPWKATPLHAKSGSNTSPYTFRNGVSWTPPPGTFRRFNDASMRTLDEGNEIWFGIDGKQIPCRKTFLSEANPGVVPVTIWPYKEVGHNHEANNELKELKLNAVFDNPKPSRLFQRAILLASSREKNDIVLDFFAGSATTASAVMALNADDGGTRRFILMQSAEPCAPGSEAYKAGFASIADLSKERIRRAGSLIKARNTATAAQLDTGFRVFRIDSSHTCEIPPSPDQPGI